jgi:hypothetical protein
MSGIWGVAEPALIGAGVIALPIGLNALLARWKLSRLLPVVRKAFTVLDPLLNDHLRGYSASDVRFALELVTAALADGQLSRAELRSAVQEIERRYRPSAAAGQSAATLPTGSPQQRLVETAAALVSSRDSHRDRASVLLDAVQTLRLQLS